MTLQSQINPPSSHPSLTLCSHFLYLIGTVLLSHSEAAQSLEGLKAVILALLAPTPAIPLQSMPDVVPVSAAEKAAEEADPPLLDSPITAGESSSIAAPLADTELKESGTAVVAEAETGTSPKEASPTPVSGEEGTAELEAAAAPATMEAPLLPSAEGTQPDSPSDPVSVQEEGGESESGSAIPNPTPGAEVKSAPAPAVEQAPDHPGDESLLSTTSAD